MRRRFAELLALGFLTLLCFSSARGATGSWLRPADPDGPLIWGRTDGVIFGLPSKGGLRGPRGLIRVGILGISTQEPELVNFIAIEPTVAGPGLRQYRKGLSELEVSQLDPGRRGMRLWVHVPEGEDRAKAVGGELVTLQAIAHPLLPGEIATLPLNPQPVEELSVRIDVEPFPAIGAKVYVIARMRSDAPQEIAFSVHQDADSAPLEELTLSATMGNYPRLRYLWLRNRLIESRPLYDHQSDNARYSNFMERENFPLVDMLRNWNGDAVVLCTGDEANPAAVTDLKPPWWNYQSIRLTHYWRVPARDVQPDLRVRVNGRRVYWRTETPLPGGTAFENFELRQRYVPGQVYIFGLTTKEPWEFRPPLPGLPPLPQK